MKVESSREEGFKPIELRITIESEDELLCLWSRLVTSWDVAMEAAEAKGLDPRIPDNEPDGIYNLWYLLDSFLGENHE